MACFPFSILNLGLFLLALEVGTTASLVMGPLKACNLVFGIFDLYLKVLHCPLELISVLLLGREAVGI